MNQVLINRKDMRIHTSRIRMSRIDMSRIHLSRGTKMGKAHQMILSREETLTERRL